VDCGILLRNVHIVAIRMCHSVLSDDIKSSDGGDSKISLLD